MTKKLERITMDPGIMNGQPCIRGMRLTVKRIVESVALYGNWADLQAEYPEIEREDIREALEFAANYLDDQIIPMEAA